MRVLPKKITPCKEGTGTWGMNGKRPDLTVGPFFTTAHAWWQDCPLRLFFHFSVVGVDDVVIPLAAGGRVTRLAGLTRLRDLNLTRDGMVPDLSPLYELPNLERFWWGHMDKIPNDQKKIMREKHKGCKFVMVYDPTDGGWRNHSHYKELHSFFRTGEYIPFSK